MLLKDFESFSEERREKQRFEFFLVLLSALFCNRTRFGKQIGVYV